MTVLVELLLAVVLSYALIRGYRALSVAGSQGRDAVALDVFLGIGVVAVTILWFMVLSTAMVA